jgi:phi LC3 family holin
MKMKNINWKVRLKNKVFWVTAVPAVLLLVTQVAALFGFEMDLSGIGEQLTDIIGTVFMLLSLAGVVVDMTTPGVRDSERAMQYVKPGVPGEVKDGE